jgi:nascent polypeptide-associated complex subunit alpha
MIPGMGGGLDPKQMQRAMRQMGIDSKEISANRVIIEQDTKKIVIEDPQVTLITMQGQKSFQIAGKVIEQAQINDDDIKMVAESANCSEEDAKNALEQNDGDIAEAILKLQEKKEE